MKREQLVNIIKEEVKNTVSKLNEDIDKDFSLRWYGDVALHIIMRRYDDHVAAIITPEAGWEGVDKQEDGSYTINFKGNTYTKEEFIKLPEIKQKMKKMYTNQMKWIPSKKDGLKYMDRGHGKARTDLHTQVKALETIKKYI